MKEIPRKNYLIYLGVCLATFLLLFLFINRVRTMNIEKKSVLTGFLYEITDNNILDNLESYAIDNSDFFLYISNHNNSSDFDVEFKQFIADYYNEEELNNLFKVVKDTSLELIVYLTAFYGLRRSEVLGIRWSAIDFENKTITINHKVVTVTDENENSKAKTKTITKRKTKNKSSYRTLPLF